MTPLKKQYFTYIPNRDFTLSQWIKSRIFVFLLNFPMLMPYAYGNIINVLCFFISLYLLVCADLNFINYSQPKNKSLFKKIYLLLLLFNSLCIFIIIFILPYYIKRQVIVKTINNITIQRSEYPFPMNYSATYFVCVVLLYFFLPPLICFFSKKSRFKIWWKHS